MSKSYECKLRLNTQLNGKNHQPTFNNLVYGCKSFQKANDQPIAACEEKLNYFHIYVHSHYQKEYLIKNCILFLFGRVC
jgi:hypothetical protein